MIEITIPFAPMGWQRVTPLKGGGVIVPKETREWEQGARRVAASYCSMRGIKPTADPVRLDVVAYFRPADSWPAWKKQAALQGLIAHTAKPDTDNIIKIVKDAMNGVLYVDDSRVSQCGWPRKLYAEKACVVISMHYLDALPCQVDRKADLDAFLLERMNRGKHHDEESTATAN